LSKVYYSNNISTEKEYSSPSRLLFAELPYVSPIFVKLFHDTTYLVMMKDFVKNKITLTS
tara:strand:+ start:498 stop:677 length:180 start_codon:yes stop_codon:yes gene_type:complete